jgi:hypothetical protein
MRVTEFDARDNAALAPTIMVKTPNPPSPPTFNGKSDVHQPAVVFDVVGIRAPFW